MVEPWRLGPLTLQFIQAHPADAAATLDHVDSAQVTTLVVSLPPALGAGIIGGLSPLAATHCMRAIDERVAAAIVRQLPVDPAAVLLARLDPERRERIVGRLPAAAALPLKLVLGHRPGTLGAITDSEVLTVRPDMRVGDVVRLARKNPGQLRKYLYVLDPQQRLLGTVDTRTCLLAGRDTGIDTLLRGDSIALRANSSVAEAREHEAWTRFNLLPVVNRGGQFLGIVRLAGLVRALSQETPQTGRTSVGETLMSLADLYWQGSAALLVGPDTQTGESKHEQ